MTSPLYEMKQPLLNCSTPPSTLPGDSYEVQTYTVCPGPSDSPEGPSPLGTAMKRKSPEGQENISPSKSRHLRIRSGAELSPLKILSAPKMNSPEPTSPKDEVGTAPRAASRSPRKMSPEKRFPVKVSNPLDMPSQVTQTKTITLEEAIRDNNGLKHAIDIFEDEQSLMDCNDAPSAMDVAPGDETAGPDDTMVSTFSTFSAVPDLTMFAKLGQSPTRMTQASCAATPRASRPATASKRDSGNTTNLLMDFTEQLRNPHKSPAKVAHLTASRVSPMGSSATPRRQLSNLIDFDIPPMPTPRSVPSITPRELESLKSNFLSEISSLKASLSGKEAEVQSLKSAVGDAEKRVGESLEKLREEQIAREQLSVEKQEWESRGREMESVLRDIKDEIMHGRKERDELEQKLDESEKRREAAEMLHQEAESKMAGMRAGRESASPEKAADAPTSTNTNQEVELAVERVARELHGLYKSKHETKVTALKKSYESRWSKKVKELETRVDQLNEENEKLRVGRDATITKVDPNSAEFGELKAQAVKDSAAMKELKADVQRLEAVVTSMQNDNNELRGLLENERIEKGELVQLAEEMMSMQSFVGSSQAQQQQQQQQQQQPIEQQTPRLPPPSSPQHRRQEERGHADPQTAKTPKSTIRASGLRAPGTALRPPHERTKSGGGGGLPRPGGGARSGIMSSIERMGNHRGRGAAE